MFALKLIGKVGIVGAISAMVLNAYDLFIIEEEETPLAGGPVSQNFYLLTVVAAIVLLCLVAIAMWVFARRKYSVRYVELKKKQGESDVKVPLSIRSLKEMIALTEAEITSKLV